MPTSNRYLQAFKEQFNVVGLASACALSAATLNPLPLLAAVVAEAAYLIFVPDSRWYNVRLSRRHDAEVAQRRQELKAAVFPQLRAEMQQRFLRLEALRQQINNQHFLAGKNATSSRPSKPCPGSIQNWMMISGRHSIR